MCEGGEAICVSCFIASHFARHLSAAYLITISAGGHLSLVKEHHIFFFYIQIKSGKRKKKNLIDLNFQVYQQREKDLACQQAVYLIDCKF